MIKRLLGTLSTLGMAGIAGALTAAMATANPANATLMLEIDDAVSGPITFIDNVGPDLDSRLGVLAINTSIGEFDLVFSLAQSKPFIGGPTVPIIDVTFAVISFNVGGTLTVSVTNTDFQGSGTNVGICEVGGTTGGTIDYACFFDGSNTAFAQTEQIAGVGPFSGLFAGGANGTFDVNGLYSLTDVLTITHGGGIVTTIGNANIRMIPEPSTLSLFATGLAGLGFMGWRRRRRV